MLLRRGGEIQEAAGLWARLLCGSMVDVRGWQNKREEDQERREKRWRKKGDDSMGEGGKYGSNQENRKERERRYVRG